MVGIFVGKRGNYPESIEDDDVSGCVLTPIKINVSNISTRQLSKSNGGDLPKVRGEPIAALNDSKQNAKFIVINYHGNSQSSIGPR